MAVLHHPELGVEDQVSVFFLVGAKDTSYPNGRAEAEYCEMFQPARVKRVEILHYCILFIHAYATIYS